MGKWSCSVCTFENDADREECSMCQTKKKKKYSPRNPYRKQSRTKANVKRNEQRSCSVSSIVGDDILSNFFDEDDDDDIEIDIGKNKNKNVKIDINADDEDEDDD